MIDRYVRLEEVKVNGADGFWQPCLCEDWPDQGCYYGDQQRTLLGTATNAYGLAVVQAEKEAERLGVRCRV